MFRFRGVLLWICFGFSVLKAQQNLVTTIRVQVPFETEWLSNFSPSLQRDLQPILKQLAVDTSLITFAQWLIKWDSMCMPLQPVLQEQLALLFPLSSGVTLSDTSAWQRFLFSIQQKQVNDKSRVERILKRRLQQFDMGYHAMQWIRYDQIHIQFKENQNITDLKLLLEPAMKLSFWVVTKNDISKNKMFQNTECDELVDSFNSLIHIKKKDEINNVLFSPAIGYTLQQDTFAVNQLIYELNAQSCFLNQFRFMWGAHVEVSGNELHYLFALKPGSNGKASISGDFVSKAKAQLSAYGEDSYEVSMEMKEKAHEAWAKLTAQCAKNQSFIAVVIDDYVHCSPRVMSEISKGRSVISGNFSKMEAERIAHLLTIGSLPFPLVVRNFN